MKIIEKIKSYRAANDFLRKVRKDYFSFSSNSEIIYDLWIPALLSIVFVVFFVNDSIPLEELLESFVTVNGHVITALSILAGFNFASISLLASSHSDTINTLKGTISEENSSEKSTVTLFDMLLIFFSWAIIIQIVAITFIVVILSLISFTNFDTGINRLLFKIICAIWITLILHSLLVTIRNVKNMYYFMRTKRDYKSCGNK